MFRYGRILLGILLLSTAAVVAWPQGTPDFSGQWKQDNDRCQPKRNGEVTLGIEHREPELTMETSISRNPASSRHAATTSFLSPDAQTVWNYWRATFRQNPRSLWPT